MLITGSTTLVVKVVKVEVLDSISTTKFKLAMYDIPVTKQSHHINIKWLRFGYVIRICSLRCVERILWWKSITREQPTQNIEMKIAYSVLLILFMRDNEMCKSHFTTGKLTQFQQRGHTVYSFKTNKIRIFSGFVYYHKMIIWLWLVKPIRSKLNWLS